MDRLPYQDSDKGDDRRSGKDRRLASDTTFMGADRRRFKDRRSGIERREHKRFKVKDLTFAKLWSQDEEDYVQDMGQLLDISPKGLSLRCSLMIEKTAQHSGLGIFLSGSDFSIDKIPFKIVSHIEITGLATFNRQGVNRCGVHFENLTTDQQSKLDYFLANHTAGKA